MTKDFFKEVFFKAARSGGKGGQNVNKVETMVEAWWYIADSRYFSAAEKALLLDKLKNRINKEGYLLVRCSDTRSQLENKALALERLTNLVAALVLLFPRKENPPGYRKLSMKNAWNPSVVMH